jgi:RNA polymerase sigma-70 factor (ECF subfamily)
VSPPWESDSAPYAERDRHADLVEAIARHRDRQAFSELFQHFAPRVKGYLLRLRADEGLAEELAQEVMVTVWRKAEQFDRRQASVATWVFRIARNRRIDAIRRAKKPDLDPNDPLLLPPPNEAADVAMTTAEREREVRTALLTLPPEQKDLLRAAFYDGLTQREISDQTGVPLGTVKSRMRLAFQKLKARLEGEP